jgi:endonuclease/exonuclease/phosphatase family metal-dependent hydrolase
MIFEAQPEAWGIVIGVALLDWGPAVSQTLLFACCIACAGPTPNAAVLPKKADSTLRVATWNIKAAQQSSVSKIATRLRSIDADVVALQEVDVLVPRSGEVDEPRELAASLGYNYFFTESIPLDGGGYGIALLTKVALRDATKIDLSNVDAAEKRTAQSATVCLQSQCVRVVNHHADLVDAAAQRSMAEILDAVRSDIGKGLLIVGDFNQRPTDDGPDMYVHAGLVDTVAVFDARATTINGIRVDFIFADQLLRSRLLASGVVSAPESDHDLVFADLSLP